MAYRIISSIQTSRICKSCIYSERFSFVELMISWNVDRFRKTVISSFHRSNDVLKCRLCAFLHTMPFSRQQWDWSDEFFQLGFCLKVSTKCFIRIWKRQRTKQSRNCQWWKPMTKYLSFTLINLWPQMSGSKLFKNNCPKDNSSNFSISIFFKVSANIRIL